MIVELREIGRVNEAPILLAVLQLRNKDWLGLAYKNNLGFLSICFWSARDDHRTATTQLIQEIEKEVVTLAEMRAANQESEVLFDVRYKQPPGWDRWLGGVPQPIRSYFDDVLHTRLKALIGTMR